MKRTTNKTTKNKNNSNNNNNINNSLPPENTQDVREVNTTRILENTQAHIAQHGPESSSFALSSLSLPIKPNSPIYNPSPSPPPVRRTFGTLPSFLLGNTSSAPAPAPSTTTTTTTVAQALPMSISPLTLPEPEFNSANLSPIPKVENNSPKEGGRRKKKSRKHKTRQTKKSRRQTKRRHHAKRK